MTRARLNKYFSACSAMEIALCKLNCPLGLSWVAPDGFQVEREYFIMIPHGIRRAFPRDMRTGPRK